MSSDNGEENEDNTGSSEELPPERLPQKRKSKQPSQPQETPAWQSPQDKDQALRLLSSILLSGKFAWNKRHVEVALAILQAHPSLASDTFKFPVDNLLASGRAMNDELENVMVRVHHNYNNLPFPPLYHFLHNFGGGSGEGKGDAVFWFQAVKTVYELFPDALKGPKQQPAKEVTMLPLHVACASKHVPVDLLQFLIKRNLAAVHVPSKGGTIFPWDLYLDRCLSNISSNTGIQGTDDTNTEQKPTKWKELLKPCDMLWSDKILDFSDRSGKENYAMFDRLLVKAVKSGPACKPIMEAILARTPNSFCDQWFTLKVDGTLTETILNGLDILLPRLTHPKLALELPLDALVANAQPYVAAVSGLMDKHGLQGLRIFVPAPFEGVESETPGIDNAFVAGIAKAMQQQATTTDSSSFLECLELHGPFDIHWESLVALISNNGRTRNIHLWSCKLILPKDITSIQQQPSCHRSGVEHLNINQTVFRVEDSPNPFEVQCFVQFWRLLSTIPTLNDLQMTSGFRDHYYARHDATKEEMSRAIVAALETGRRPRKLYLCVPICWKLIWEHLKTNDTLTEFTLLGIQQDVLGKLAPVLKNHNTTLCRFDCSIQYRGSEEDLQVQYFLFQNRWRKKIHANPDINCAGFLDLLVEAVEELKDPDVRKIAGGEMSAFYGLLRENLSLCLNN